MHVPETRPVFLDVRLVHVKELIDGHPKLFCELAHLLHELEIEVGGQNALTVVAPRQRDLVEVQPDPCFDRLDRIELLGILEKIKINLISIRQLQN